MSNLPLSATTIVRADIETSTEVVVYFSPAVPPALVLPDIAIRPEVRIDSLKRKKDRIILATAELDIRTNYTVTILGVGEKPLRPAGILDRYKSEKPLGCLCAADSTVFRLFSPRATGVVVEILATSTQETGTRYAMKMDSDGVWEVTVPENLVGKFYGYRVSGPEGVGEMFDPGRLIADPYSPAVATQNSYLHEGKTLILDDDYDWQGDTFLGYDWRDLIILEAHARDLTAHASAGVALPERGTFAGLLDKNSPGGLNYARDLGVNAVEFLPIQDFGNIEVPFKDPQAPVFNDWNPYARNHWGYMTSYFFAPESYYATGATMAPNAVTGANGRAVQEFKDVVKAFHQAGIAVILDVVYNHVAQYDQNCLKYTDKKYYFRLDGDLNFVARSGCGNDLQTERPMARRLIVDSILYWMRAYHVDGFRFDLAAMLDWETIDKIREEAQKINPRVILIAEPWGGGEYEPAEFSKHDWAAWNDQLRNGVKGQNYRDGLGFIFGKWQGKNNLRSLRSFITGTLAEDGGLFQDPAHAVNYLESHDDNTLGDFIRLATGAVQENEIIADVEKNARLDASQLQLHRLAALCLFTSQGPVMLAEGQDWGRSKVIAPSSIANPLIGRIDHNSYEKDDATNWLDWHHRELNKELVDYYRGLISLRRRHPVFRHARKADIGFLDSKTPFATGYLLHKSQIGDTHDFIVLLNGNSRARAKFQLPQGDWQIVVDETTVYPEGRRRKNVHNEVILLPTTGIILQARPDE